MDALILIVAGFAALLGFDWLAVRFGANSRNSIGDDHVGQTRTAAL